MKKLYIMLIVIFLTISMSLVGISCKTTTAETTAAETTAAETTVAETTVAETTAAEAVTITWWVGSWKYEDGRAQKVVKDFEALNPNITVEITPLAWDGMYEKELTAMMSKQGPDVMFFASQWANALAATGGLLDLTYIVDDLGKDYFVEEPLNWAKIDDKYCGLPYRSGTYCLFYNKTMLADAGLEGPPATLAQFAEYAKKLTSDSVYGFAIALKKTDGGATIFPRTVFRSYGADFLSPDETKATFNTEEAIKALTYLRDLYIKDKALSPDSLNADWDAGANGFAASQVAMIIDGNWRLKTFTDAGLDYGVTKIPGLDESNPGTIDIAGWSLGISANSTKVDAAEKFIRFFLQPENDAYLTDSLPGVVEAFTAERFNTPETQVFIDQLAYGSPQIVTPLFPVIQSAIAVGIQRIFLGEDVTTVANEVNEEIQKIIDEQ